jgi:hypothetical protein
MIFPERTPAATDPRYKALKRSFLCLYPVTLFVMFCVAMPSYSQDSAILDSGPVLLPQAILYRSVDWIKNLPLPAFSWVKAQPGTPAVLDIGIASRFQNGKPVFTKEAQAFLSANGGRNWKAYELGQVEQGRWVAKTGAGSLASLYARNSAGGSIIELACPMVRAPAASQGFFETNGRRPIGCFFASGPEDQPIDDPASKIGDDLDIFDFRAGYDSKYFYFGLMIEGDYSTGSLTPTVLHQYSVLVFDPASQEKVPDGILPLAGVMVRYIPMGKKAPSLATACGAVVYRNKAMALDTKSVECKDSSQFLVFKVSRSLWGNKQPQELLIFAFTGTLRNRNLDEFSFVDYTGFTRVKFSGRVLKVGVGEREKSQAVDKPNDAMRGNIYR